MSKVQRSVKCEDEDIDRLNTLNLSDMSHCFDCHELYFGNSFLLAEHMKHSNPTW